MKNKETIDALNTLIEINNNRIEGYSAAAKHSKNEDTKNILSQLLYTCKNCKTELISEILQLGGVPSKGVKGTGWFFRLLVSARQALRKDLQRSTLNACSYRESVALGTYNEVLINRSGHIGPDLTDLLIAQHVSIQNNHRDVKNLQLKYGL